MKKVELNEATASLAEYVEDLSREAVVVTRRGKPIAAVVAIEDADWETIRLTTDPHFLRIIQKSRERHQSEGGITPDEMRSRLRD